MPWNSTAPLGSISVKSNKPKLQENTTYIEVTMGNSVVGTNTVTTRDHFWNVGANEDGRHRFIQSVGFTVGSVPTDPVIGTGMDGVQYLKSDGLTPARVEGFYRNAEGVYQHIPAFLTGSVASIPSSYVTVVSIPDNVYGEIFMYSTVVSPLFPIKYNTVTGFFRSNGGLVQAWTLINVPQGANTGSGLKFANGSDASGLNIRARAQDAPNGALWNYRITYRAI